jgi:hypothetical protein
MRVVAGVVGCGLAILPFASWTAEAAPLAAPKGEPHPIFGGFDAGVCGFPSAVGMLDRDTDQLFCSGTLIHPQVVSFAAHCMDPDISWAVPGRVMFGEDVAAPVREVEVVSCETHPQWDNGTNAFDLAACVLAEPVVDVPIAPLLMGCEAEALQPGVEVVIVGFGATSATLDPEGNPIPEGAGRKRYTTQTLTDILPDDNQVVMVGPDKGGCFGDSGGPAFVMLADGTWRTIGAASTLHPDSVPDPNGQICGFGTVYEIFWREMAWLEAMSGFDVTPCFDADGTWAPTSTCAGFPGVLIDPAATWANGCATTAVGGWSAACGAPFDGSEPPPPEPPPPEPPPPEPPPPDPEPEPPPQPEPEPQPEPAPEPAPEPDDSATGGPAEDLTERGCTCAQGQPVPADMLGLLALLGLVRRRRR